VLDERADPVCLKAIGDEAARVNEPDGV